MSKEYAIKEKYLKTFKYLFLIKLKYYWHIHYKSSLCIKINSLRSVLDNKVLTLFDLLFSLESNASSIFSKSHNV